MKLNPDPEAVLLSRGGGFRKFSILEVFMEYRLLAIPAFRLRYLYE